MKIKDIGTVVTGKTPATSHAEFYDGDYMFVTPTELHGGYKVSASEKTITDAGLKSIKSNMISGISVLVGCIGWDMGNVAMCFEKCATNQQINSVTRIKDSFNPYYLYYWLSTKKDYLFSVASVTRTPILSKGVFEEIEIPNIDRLEQDKISKILLALDQKIEYNAAVNDNLQQQLRLMYDYWFNQFDFPNEEGKPYRTSGGAMEWCPELQRKIPAGWSCVSLEDIIQKNSEAFDFSSIEPTVDLSIMPSGSIALDRVNRSDKFSTNLFRMNEGDILFGSIRPYLKKAGIAPCNGVVAGTIHSFRVKKETDYNFALFTLCGKAFFDYAVKVSTGTKMPIVSLDSIMSYKLPYSESIVRRFNHIDVRHTICSNVQETQKLAALRDWLLPMLMNGQATISD